MKFVSVFHFPIQNSDNIFHDFKVSLNTLTDSVRDHISSKVHVGTMEKTVGSR